MKLKNKTLDEWLKMAPASSYYLQKKVGFHSKFLLLKDFLEKNVYDHVVIGAHLKDPQLLLNDHGINHVEAVIEKATELIACETCDFMAYEIHLLLLSILLHDVGVIFGRYNHEINVNDIFLKAMNLCGEDTVESIQIKKIIECHGGKIQGTQDKDKISTILPEKDNSLNGEVRYQAIASVLRFADELSDDKRRTSPIIMEQANFPKESEVYHAYSLNLDSVSVDHSIKSVKLNYNLSINSATRTYGSMNGDIFLLDEIYNRILKMHCERIYCMRFLKGIIDINRLSVSINFYGDRLDSNILPKIKFEVYESGYPQTNNIDLFGLCKPLMDESGKKIDGEYIRKKIEEINSSQRELGK